MPHEPYLLPHVGKVAQQVVALYAGQELHAERCHAKGGRAELDPIGQGSHRMLAVAEQVPVHPQSEAIIPVAAGLQAILPVGTVWSGQDGFAVDFQLDLLGLTYPARNEPDTTLKSLGSQYVQGTNNEVDDKRVLPGRGAIAPHRYLIRPGGDGRDQQEILAVAAIVVSRNLLARLPQGPDGVHMAGRLDRQRPGLGHGNLEVIDITRRSNLARG